MLVVRAAEWADLHPSVEDPATRDGDEATAFVHQMLPGVDSSCTATFALAIGLSDAAGTALIVDAIHLRERLPRTWARLVTGELQAWRARRITQAILSQPDDVTAMADQHVAPIAHRVGSATVERLVHEANIRLHPAETEQAEIAVLERRHVRMLEDITHEGVASMEIRADLKDVLDFDATISRIASALADVGDPAHPEDLDVRRSRAVGILADPRSPIPEPPPTCWPEIPTRWSGSRHADGSSSSFTSLPTR
ncbi:MAG: DUF222 domain-containing protein [Nocardioides sp.]